MSTPAVEGGPAGAAGSNTLLIVDDDANVLRVMRRALESAGYRVLVAQGPLEAIRLFELEADSITLLITDVTMPDLTGPQMVARLSERRPALPVLYVSGYADEAEIAVMVRQGAPLLPKPFMPAALVQKVRELIERA